MFSNTVTQMNKVWHYANITWANGFAYPLSFALWRFRQVLSFIIAFSLWDAIYASSSQAFGYSKAEMLTYIFIANIISYFVLSSRTVYVANMIRMGELSILLVRPIRFFSFWFASDIADKLQNLLFAVVELSILFFLFRPPLFFPSSSTIVALTLIVIFLAMLLYFFINLCLGFLAFWSPDVWAPRFLFMMVLQLTAGSFFPLDVFPQQIVSLLSFTPLPYLMYFPAKIWLQQLRVENLYQGLIILSIWIALFYLLANFLWKRGLKQYGAEGR